MLDENNCIIWDLGIQNNSRFGCMDKGMHIVWVDLGQLAFSQDPAYDLHKSQLKALGHILGNCVDSHRELSIIIRRSRMRLSSRLFFANKGRICPHLLCSFTSQRASHCPQTTASLSAYTTYTCQILFHSYTISCFPRL